jgi:hypothetical protein
MIHRVRRLMVLFGLALAAAPLDVARGQGASISPQCPAGSLSERVTQDACQKAVDVFRFLAPQLGIAIAGGNSILGEGSALSGPGRFSLGLRANGLQARLPRIDRVNPGVSGAEATDYEIDEQLLGLPAIDAAVGLFKGLPLGATDVLAVDALVSLAYLPEVDADNVSISVPDGSIRLGFGARVGVLQESFVTPGISVSYLQRELPTVDLVGSPGDNQIAVRNFGVEVREWRVVASKHLALLGFAAGYGRDMYDSHGSVEVSVAPLPGQPVTAGPIELEQELTRANLFLDVSLNLTAFRLVAELGRTSGGTIGTFNTFSGDRADDAIEYVSLGFRLRW